MQHKLKMNLLRTLRRSHQQATLTLDCPHSPEKESPTMPTAAEAKADSPWNPEESSQEATPMPDSPQNPEEESPAGNPDFRLPLQTRGGVINYADCHRSASF